MSAPSLISLAISLAMLVVAYLMLRSAERRMRDARDFYAKSKDALQEARVINAESAGWLKGRGIR